ncbi:hypothetical protein [Azospirillum sp. TSO35-2]|uniref:hypothetical protein n=1 Tax=Azospirillum sp. TSO35-2 TaxID=716796 RepID=UPI000D60C769|nr:hypothetical protein [Azospirillum sp. TSO35-2]PWC33113.1 hypothetical protein TSO352_21480 [Azospirillum sp. TSO35-2]
MREVAGMPYPAVRPAVRPGWTAAVSAAVSEDGRADRQGRGTDGATRVGSLGLLASFAAQVLAATVLAAVTLHLLAALAARLPSSDALGALSVMVGMTVVLVTLLPFTLLWVRRAQQAWTAIHSAAGR